MSGGIAYVYDENVNFERRFNPDMIGIERVSSDDSHALRQLVERHLTETGSPRAKSLLDDWANSLTQFWKVTPHPETTPTTQKIEPKQSGKSMDGTAEDKLSAPSNA